MHVWGGKKTGSTTAVSKVLTSPNADRYSKYFHR